MFDLYTVLSIFNVIPTNALVMQINFVDVTVVINKNKLVISSAAIKWVNMRERADNAKKLSIYKRCFNSLNKNLAFTCIFYSNLHIWIKSSVYRKADYFLCLTLTLYFLKSSLLARSSSDSAVIDIPFKLISRQLISHIFNFLLRGFLGL